MLFYRVCHRTKFYDDDPYKWHHGPYNNGSVFGRSDDMSEMSLAHCNRFTHPTLTDDVFPQHWVECSDEYDDPTHDCERLQCNAYPGDYLCGFVSLETLHLWFAGWTDVLRREGYVIRVWDVDETSVRSGSRQSACRISQLTRDPLTILEMTDSV